MVVMGRRSGPDDLISVTGSPLLAWSHAVRKELRVSG